MIGFELTEDQKAIRDLAETFARKEILPAAAELDRTMAYPMELVKKAHAAGLLNPSIPAEYGGAGLNSPAMTRERK